MNRTGLLGLLLIGIIVASPLMINSDSTLFLGRKQIHPTMTDPKPVTTTTFSLSYELHDRISISDDLDWVEQGIPGSGTEQYPYIIENLEIAHNQECIFIVYTSKYYIIRNCLLRSDSISGEGIYINHADHGRVENCTITMKGYGVYVMNSNGLVITNNTMHNLSRSGVRLSTSNDCNVTSNKIYDTLDDGIYCQSSSSRIENNTVWNSADNALYMLSCSSSSIVHNTFWNSTCGTYLESCDLIAITDNYFNYNKEIGFRNYDSDNLNFANNSIQYNKGYGVHWNRGDDATIANNHINGNSQFGFELYYARNANVFDNVFVNDGLVLSGGDILDFKHTITGNLVNGKTLGYFFNTSSVFLNGNAYGQILVVNCSGLDIQGGVISQADLGIAFHFSTACTVNSTTISDQMLGVYLRSSDFCNITETTLENCGIYISGSDSDNWRHNFMGTTVNGKPLGYFFETSDQTLDDDSFGQIIIVNSTRMLIKDYNFTRTTMGIALAFSTDCNISQSVIADSYTGLRLQGCSNCLFENITIDLSVNVGFLSYYSNDCVLKNITIQEAGYGLYLYGCYDISVNGSRFSYNSYGAYLSQSEYLNISQCTFESNYEAFYTYYCDNSTIRGCDILHSLNYGFRIYYSDWIEIHDSTVSYNANLGIFCMGSTYGKIIGNTITRNQVDGVHLYYGDHYNLINNTIEENVGYGINLNVFSDYNTVYGNNFSSNAEGNAYAYQSTNTWDDGVSVGNFWDDYIGPGVYSIQGPGNNVDRFPRGPAVVLSSHSDVSYHLGTIGASFTWASFSAEPDHYIIYLEGAVHSEGVWDGLAIHVDVDTSSLGIYNYTLFINSTSGEYKIDTVLVTIYDNNPTINSPPDTGYNFDTTGHNILWSPNDLNPYGYYVYLNDDLYTSGIWDGSPVQLDIDGLPVGIHIFTLLVNDTSGNSISDSVQVTVWDTEPWLNSPDDITYVYGTPGVKIWWNASDFNPANYTVYKNSSVETTTIWNGQSIFYDVDGLDLGVYNYTIMLVDTSGQTVSDTVFVFVVAATTTTTTTTSTTTTTFGNGTDTQLESLIILIISVASAGIILIVLITVLRKRP